MAGYTPARVAVLGQGLPFAGARRVRADQVSTGDVYVDGLVGHRSDKVALAICYVGSVVVGSRGRRVLSTDPRFRCIRCSSCGFCCLRRRNIQAEEPVGSGSVIMWLTARPVALAPVGLLPNYPVVSRLGDSVPDSPKRCGAVLSVMSGGLPEFGIGDWQISSSAPWRSSSPRDRRSELVAKSFDEIDQHCAM
jgi:hypothetical protein